MAFFFFGNFSPCLLRFFFWLLRGKGEFFFFFTLGKIFFFCFFFRKGGRVFFSFSQKLFFSFVKKKVVLGGIRIWGKTSIKKRPAVFFFGRLPVFVFAQGKTHIKIFFLPLFSFGPPSGGGKFKRRGELKKNFWKNLFVGGIFFFSKKFSSSKPSLSFPRAKFFLNIRCCLSWSSPSPFLFSRKISEIPGGKIFYCTAFSHIFIKWGENTPVFFIL